MSSFTWWRRPGFPALSETLSRGPELTTSSGPTRQKTTPPANQRLAYVIPTKTLLYRNLYVTEQDRAQGPRPLRALLEREVPRLKSRNMIFSDHRELLRTGRKTLRIARRSYFQYAPRQILRDHGVRNLR